MPRNDLAEGTLDPDDYEDQSEFRYAMRRFLRFSEIQSRKEGVTPQQHLVLLMVRGHPNYPRVSIGDVAERLQIKHHSASLLVERSVQNGLLNRRLDVVDKRRANVSLTAKGEEVLKRVTVANRAELSALQSQLFKPSFIESIRRKRREAERERAAAAAR